MTDLKRALPLGKYGSSWSDHFFYQRLDNDLSNIAQHAHHDLLPHAESCRKSVVSPFQHQPGTGNEPPFLVSRFSSNRNQNCASSVDPVKAVTEEAQF